MHTLLIFALGLSLGLGAGLATPTPEDPFIWLEDAHGARAMAWVEAENAKTTAVIESDPRFETLYNDAKTIAEAKDRIPEPNMLGGRVWNFWQDADHQHGIWRQTSLPDFKSAAPNWRTVLDLDALSKAEKANWFWKGANCHEPEEERCIVSLSDGGEDAVTAREFDLRSSRFADGGFSLPSGKQDIAWLDSETLLVAREWKTGELTKSGYAFVVKRVKRGQALDAAVEAQAHMRANRHFGKILLTM